MTKFIIHEEEWRPVAGYEGFYEASSRGRIRSLHRTVRSANQSGPVAKALRGRAISPATQQSGHLHVILYKNGKKSTQRVHRLVLEAFIGPCPDGMECCHLDGNPKNNHISNLRWGTHAENCADTIRHGMSNRGERNGQARLTEFDVIEIRRMHAGGEGSYREISLRFGVARRSAWDIINRKTWAWL